MHLQALYRRLIVVILRHLLRQLVQLKRLHLELKVGSHQIISVPLIALGELDLVEFVLNHHLAGEDVVEGAALGVPTCEGAGLLEEADLSIEVVAEQRGV